MSHFIGIHLPCFSALFSRVVCPKTGTHFWATRVRFAVSAAKLHFLLSDLLLMGGLVLLYWAALPFFAF